MGRFKKEQLTLLRKFSSRKQAKEEIKDRMNKRNNSIGNFTCDECDANFGESGVKKHMVNTYLIFVAGRRARPMEKKSVMWRNFKFLYMKQLLKHVEKAKISPHLD